jgi:hypothetical protein
LSAQSNSTPASPDAKKNFFLLPPRFRQWPLEQVAPNLFCVVSFVAAPPRQETRSHNSGISIFELAIERRGKH